MIHGGAWPKKPYEYCGQRWAWSGGAREHSASDLATGSGKRPVIAHTKQNQSILC